MNFTVAIDGPAAAGKGTIARAVAKHFDFAHLDTGLLYRAVAARVVDGEDPARAAKNLDAADIARSDLRSGAVGAMASQVAVIPEVREALLEFQRSFARRDGGAVLDGRDIGTVICPDAEVKLFVTADDHVRARRRLSELTAAGETVAEERVLQDIRARDKRDAERAMAPLVPAEGAIILDTTELAISTAVDRAVDLVAERLG
ncbi:MAG: d(CMP) kinase [Pseudomonadota bacterium]